MQTETMLIEDQSITLYRNIIVGLSFAIPFLISGPQLLTGSLVNLFLILGTRLVDKKDHWLIAVLPSIAAVLNGLVFGKFTPFLVYFLPFIWLGNFVLIKSVIKLTKQVAFLLSLIAGVILKTVVLYASALIYLKLNVVPAIFLTAMGQLQLITGLTGGLMTLMIFRINNFNYERNR